MKRIGLLVVALAAAGILTGCATASRGVVSEIQFNSEPGGAEVRTVLARPYVPPTAPRPDVPFNEMPTIYEQNCVTPCALKFNRGDAFRATFTKPGFEPKTIEVGVRVGGAGVAGMAGNILVGGAIGVVVDSATGASLEHCPSPVQVQLQPVKGPRVPETAIDCKPPRDPNGPINP